MARRVLRRSPKPLQKAASGIEAVESPQTLQTVKSAFVNLKAEIIANWKLPSDNIETCVSPERWPSNQSDPDQWPFDIVHLLHQASELSEGNNEFFQSFLGLEIHSRQLKNKSARGKTENMTITDLKKVCKRLENMQDEMRELDQKEKQGLEQKQKQEEGNTRSIRRGRSKKNPPADRRVNATQEAENKENQLNQKDAGFKATRRGRSNGKPNIDTQTGVTQEADTKQIPQPPKATAPRARGRPKRKAPDSEASSNPVPKRQASLPIRPARKAHNIISPNTKALPKQILSPPPITPANAPSPTSSITSEAQETTPQPPVSGRHIYGALIPATTLHFQPPDSPVAAAGAAPRTTRKRARVAEQQPPPLGEEQIDPDPRDIDATGFLSELDPNERRGRGKNSKKRLSRLQTEIIDEPAWSQDINETFAPPGPPETPAVPPAILASGSESTPYSPAFAAFDAENDPNEANTPDGEHGSNEVFYLPRIPSTATPSERKTLQNRLMLMRLDVAQYVLSVEGIRRRTGV